LATSKRLKKLMRRAPDCIPSAELGHSGALS
jgi:hypothetical protein